MAPMSPLDMRGQWDAAEMDGLLMTGVLRPSERQVASASPALDVHPLKTFDTHTSMYHVELPDMYARSMPRWLTRRKPPPLHWFAPERFLDSGHGDV